MKYHNYMRISGSLAMALILVSCAATDTLVATPSVRLTNVTLENMSFNKQTFLLGFEVNNPNAFPLPVNAIKYRVQLDDEHFAGGETQAGFTIPARGTDSFAISVELDILNRVNQITSLIAGGMPDNVSYRVEGSLAVDIPFTRPLPFSSSGVISIQD